MIEFALSLLDSLTEVTHLLQDGTDAAVLFASLGLFAKRAATAEPQGPSLVQEEPGFHLDISRDVTAAGTHAAHMFKQRYDAWLNNDWGGVGSQFKYHYFSVAVGGGNTVKAEYRALLEHNSLDIDWLEHVRFFFMEESTREKNWESSRDSLVKAFIEPLVEKLFDAHGAGPLTQKLDLEPNASFQAIVRRMLAVMTCAIDMSSVEDALKSGDRKLALSCARKEARRYQTLLQDALGKGMAFHMLLSGIGKDGGIGAFSTYTPQLKQKKPGAIVVEKESGSISVALNRGALVAADCISLIVSGSLKLKALGRFEMEESADFEQTVGETPIRMLRETREIAEKVFIYADERALHFDEGLFRYKENGNSITLKSEVREGLEDGGVHILLVHGFMGLYSYINFLIRLPSAWKVSALHRGTHAKRLPDGKVFPHYANALRKVILQNWRYRRPTPVGCHSMAGVISDHLLLSVLDDYESEFPDFEDLKAEDKQLIEALRCGGLIHMASWAPTDVCHVEDTLKSLKNHLRHKEPLDYGGPSSVYNLSFSGDLELNAEHCDAIDQRPAILEIMMRLPGTESVVNLFNTLMRYALGKKDLQKVMSQRATPYALRVMGGRLLRKVSIYGLLKEVNASLHDPYEYQYRHGRALEAIIHYDIPYLSIIHEDDFLVSANRHQQEHQFLLSGRLDKEGVKREENLKVPVRFVLLEREDEELPIDPLNPHLMLMSTSHEGNRISREVTAAITQFTNENLERAIKDGVIRPLDSVRKWRRGQRADSRKQRAVAS